MVSGVPWEQRTVAKSLATSKPPLVTRLPSASGAGTARTAPVPKPLHLLQFRQCSAQRRFAPRSDRSIALSDPRSRIAKTSFFVLRCVVRGRMKTAVPSEVLQRLRLHQNDSSKVISIMRSRTGWTRPSHQFMIANSEWDGSERKVSQDDGRESQRISNHAAANSQNLAVDCRGDQSTRADLCAGPYCSALLA